MVVQATLVGIDHYSARGDGRLLRGDDTVCQWSVDTFGGHSVWTSRLGFGIAYMPEHPLVLDVSGAVELRLVCRDFNGAMMSKTVRGGRLIELPMENPT